METRNSVLIVGLYLLGALAVAGVMYYAYDRTMEASRAQQQLNSEAESITSRRARVPFQTTTLAVAARPSELQASLAATRAQLQQRTSDLNKKNAECRALKTELDQAFSLILNLLYDQPTDTTAAAHKKRESELLRLQEALRQAEASNRRQEQELIELQAEMMQNSADLEMTQQEAKREIESLTAERQSADEAMRALLERIGVAAVPALTELISNQNAEIRKWAAKQLSTLGMDAADAQTSLQELLNDPEPSVRAEAQLALASISGAEID